MMEALQSSAPVGLACLDRDFRFVRVNDALAEMNRLPVDDHIARPVAEIIPEFWPQLELPVAASLRRASRSSITTWAVTARRVVRATG
jgi:PAS domain-containing protein